MHYSRVSLGRAGHKRLRLIVGGLSLFALGACGRPAANEPLPEKPGTPAPMAGAVFAHVCNLGENGGFKSFVAANQTALTADSSGLRIHATGTDPQLAPPKLNVAPGSRVAFRIDLDSPAATRLELFFLTAQTTQFSEDHVVQAQLQPGRNVLLLEISDPQFNGALRFDPGEVAGDYVLHAMEIFGQAPVNVESRQALPEELAAAFALSATILFEAKSADALAKLKALNQATLAPGPDGLLVTATGDDPELSLPEFAAGQHCIVKIVLAAPRDTTLQLFYLTPGQANYDDAHVSNQSLKAGKATVYCEIPPGVIGSLRLDPGMLKGDYVIESVEARAAAGR